LRENRSTGVYEGEHRRRRIEIAVQLFQTMGYPDDSFPANTVVSRRRPLQDVATFIGFDQA